MNRKQKNSVDKMLSYIRKKSCRLAEHSVSKTEFHSLSTEIVISYRVHKTEAVFVPRAQPEVRKEPRFHGRAYERYFIHRETDAHSGAKR